jgi:hypothetical protein
MPQEYWQADAKGSVTPAKAGVQGTFFNRIANAWIPVSTGMTKSSALPRCC